MLAFLAGILLVQQLPALPSLAWAAALMPLLALAGWRPRWVTPLIFFLFGVLWVTWRAGLVLDERLPSNLEGVDLLVHGRAADLPVATERGLRVAFVVEHAVRAGEGVDLACRRVQLSTYGSRPPIEVGDLWSFTVRLKRPHAMQNPGGFDYEAHLFERRLCATGYVRDADAGQRLAPLSAMPGGLAASGYWLHRFRQYLSERIRQLLPDNAYASMITAFANGDDDAIPDEQWQVLNRTGTSHLIAISGMNIGLVAGIVFLLLRGVWSWPGWTVLYLPAPRVAAAGALLAAAGYAALAGFAIPTQRALVMLVVVLGGVFFGWRLAPSVLLALALLAVLLLDPLAVMAAGFWLSFVAVAVILYVITGGLGRGWRARLIAWGWVQWAVTLGLLPILLLLFQQASIVGPLANLLAIPVIESLVIPATLLGVVGVLVLPDSIAQWPFLLAATALEWLWVPLAALAHLPGVLWSQHTPALWTVAAAGVGAALLLAPRGFPARWLGALWLLPMFAVRPPGPAPGEVWFTVLDVGQGLATVVRTHGHTLVYDTGARFSARLDAGRAAVVPYLRHAGVTRVNRLIVSHGDNDHIGGSASVLSALPVDVILSSVPERLPGAHGCSAGQSWEWDNVRFSILHPALDGQEQGNNRSCVLRVDGRYGRILLPGDIALPVEKRLLRDAARHLPAEVLVVPHHGSRSSSSAAFLDAVQPRYALLPVGYRNRYRHPHPEVVARYRERGITLLDTAASGAISLRLDAAGSAPTRYRDSHRRYWHAN